ncbi:sensor domain-containing diguanylate cyclase [Desulfosarcina widdelii]|uniref:sensor domain-containing diguanylate cyclase n=1 Tax=Desulfosarcina widdelii TaxID=947919 RepID=UPI001479154A|nr:sensor domain-containing diguanylate cyclase [Desulfosarcina widdelii]
MPEEKQSGEFFASVFNAMPSMVFVVDNDVRIIEHNAAAAPLFEAESSTILGFRAGDVLHCLHSRDVSEGCGRAPSCSKCVIRNAVAEAFRGNRVVRSPHRLQLLRDGNLKEIHALVSTFPFQFRGNEYAILIVDPAKVSPNQIAGTDNSGDFQEIVLNVVDRIDAMVAFWDQNQICVFANEAYYSWFGKTRTEILGTTIKELLGPLYEQDLQYITAAYEGKKQVFERVISTPGGVRQSLVTYIPYVFGGQICGIFVHTADVTPLKELEQELQIEQYRLSSIISGTNVGTWEWNVHTGETIFNEHWAEIVGYRLEELQPVSSETWLQLAHPDDLNARRERLEKHFRHQTDIYEFEGRMKHKDGHWVWVLDKGKVFTWTLDGKPLMMFGSHQDITKRKEREQAIVSLTHQLEAQAVTDSLTGLLNRRGWKNCIAREEARTRRYGNKGCVIILDLDGLKKINDTLGHEAGDELILRATRCLRTALRDVDQIARIGGDEFAILSTECTEKNVQTILKRVEEQFESENVSASWGMAAFDRSTRIEAAQRVADKKMYEMKKRNRKNV